MIRVTCAILKHNSKVLICQRSSLMKLALKWEFPGGKIEADESKKDCLKREIFEELGTNIRIGEELTMVEYHYPDFSVRLYPFICSIESGTVQPVEHAQIRWVSPGELMNYDWADADIPIVKEYLKLHPLKYT